jgi:hypothetical protein
LRKLLALVAFVLGSVAQAAVWRRRPICRVLLLTAGSAPITPARSVSRPPRRSRSRSIATDRASPPTARSTGATTFDITVAAPPTAGAQQALQRRRHIERGHARAPPAPFASPPRERRGWAASSAIRGATSRCSNNVRVSVSAVVHQQPDDIQLDGGHDLCAAKGTSAVSHESNIVNQADTIRDRRIRLQLDRLRGRLVSGRLHPLCPGAALLPRGGQSGRARRARDRVVTLTALCDGSPTSYSWAHGATGASVVVNPRW